MRDTLRFSDDALIRIMQKPPEVFCGIMPTNRVLYTKRMYLRRFVKSDIQAVKKIMAENRAYISRWLQPLPANISEDYAAKLISDDQFQARKGKRLDLGMFLDQSDRRSKTDELLGKIALHSVDYGIQHSACLSYWIVSEKAGQGYMTEALAAISAFAFEEAGLHRLIIKTGTDNRSSLALAEKLGFRSEGVEKKALFINGSWQDSEIFSLLEEEYDQKADSWIEKGWLGR